MGKDSQDRSLQQTLVEKNKRGKEQAEKIKGARGNRLITHLKETQEIINEAGRPLPHRLL